MLLPLPLLLLALLLAPPAQEPTGELQQRLDRVQHLLATEQTGRELGAALHAVAALKSAEAVAALAALVPELDGLGRAAALQAIGMCDRPEGIEELRRIARESKHMPDRTMAVRVLAGEEDVAWLVKYFERETNGVVRAEILRELLRVKVEQIEELVLDAARDKNGEVRAAGLEGIAFLKLPAGAKLAVKAVADSNLATRIAATRAAALVGGAAGFKALLAELRKSKNDQFRAAVADALLLADEAAEIEVLVAALAREKDEVVIRAVVAGIAAAAQHAPGACAETMVEMIGNPSAAVREHAIRGLVACRPDGVLELLAGLLLHEDPVTRADAAWALGQCCGLTPAAEEKLIALARDASLSIRLNATRALVGAATAAGRAALAERLRDDFWSIRAAAVGALETQRRPEALAPLIEQLERDDSRVRDDIARALARLTGVDLGTNAQAWRGWLAEQAADYALPSLVEAEAELRRAELARESSRETVAGYHGIPLPPGGIVFVLDVSGSMNEVWDDAGTERVTRYEHFAAALKQAVAALRPEDRFTIVLFAERPYYWRAGLVDAGPAEKDDARSFLDATTAFGGTNIFDAVAGAMRLDGAQTIYLLTDGDPTVGVTNTTTIVQRIARTNRDLGITLHTIAAGEASGNFLADLAAANGGRSVDLR